MFTRVVRFVGCDKRIRCGVAFDGSCHAPSATTLNRLNGLANTWVKPVWFRLRRLGAGERGLDAAPTV